MLRQTEPTEMGRCNPSVLAVISGDKKSKLKVTGEFTLLWSHLIHDAIASAY
jgi:hypothetical protein